MRRFCALFLRAMDEPCRRFQSLVMVRLVARVYLTSIIFFHWTGFGSAFSRMK